jgi:hypothetical protein
MKETSLIIDSLVSKVGSAEIDGLKRLQDEISSIRGKVAVEKLQETFAAEAKDKLKKLQKPKEAEETKTTGRATEISLDEINLLCGNLDEVRGLNGGPILRRKTKKILNWVSFWGYWQPRFLE